MNVDWKSLVMPFRRFLIQILPAAVVAPLFFRGEIEFGVINQSSSAFNHILTDVSLVVYQVRNRALPWPFVLPAALSGLQPFRQVVKESVKGHYRV